MCAYADGIVMLAKNVSVTDIGNLRHKNVVKNRWEETKCRKVSSIQARKYLQNLTIHFSLSYDKSIASSKASSSQSAI
jgi:hypothetical protein